MPGKFSLQWTNTGASRNKSMNSVRFNIRDVQGNAGGLTCDALHVDQVHIWFTPSNDTSLTSLFQTGDDANKQWRAEAQSLHVRLTPGERFSLHTRPTSAAVTEDDMVTYPVAHQTYSASLCYTPGTGADAVDYWCRNYRPTRDLPAAVGLMGVSELQVDLLWPLLQGDSSVGFTSIPNYRISRVLVDFSYH